MFFFLIYKQIVFLGSNNSYGQAESIWKTYSSDVKQASIGTNA